MIEKEIVQRNRGEERERDKKGEKKVDLNPCEYLIGPWSA